MSVLAAATQRALIGAKHDLLCGSLQGESSPNALQDVTIPTLARCWREPMQSWFTAPRVPRPDWT
jgi:hypothetical protein